MSSTSAAPRRLDAVVVGAGFAGLYMLHTLRRRGLSALVIEAAPDVGGTWFWNRYPGARCDIESMDYSYSFSPELEQEWPWSERYATQPEILSYLRHVADRFDLRRDIAFSTRVASAVFDDAAEEWEVTTDRGDVYRARFCITAVGCLSLPQMPDFPERDDFAGALYHTGQWPAESADLTGRRIGVIGTGSSGIQVVPVLAEGAERLYVFQRTPHYSVPALNRALEPAEVAAWKAEYPARRQRARRSRIGISGYPDPTTRALDVPEAERRRTFDEAWVSGSTQIGTTYTDLLSDPAANACVAEYVRKQIRRTVKDPHTAERLIPRYHFGTKRLCIGDRYLEAFNRDNVTLVDVGSTPIERLTPAGILVGHTEYQLDAIVFATGYDAITGPLLNMDIRGRCGVRLRDLWAEGPRSYLGLMIAAFPNLFTITGPGSPSVLSNMVTSIEQHVELIDRILDHLDTSGATLIEAEEGAQSRWVEHVNDLAEASLLNTGKSWYLGANVPGKPRIFMPYSGGVGTYRQLCEEIVADSFRGFRVLRHTKTGAQKKSVPDGDDDIVFKLYGDMQRSQALW